MAIERQIPSSRAVLRLMMAVGAAALMAGCSDASRLSDPFADPFAGSGEAQRNASYRGVDRAPTGAIANPAPARVESRPLPAPGAASAPAAAPRAPVASATPAASGAGGAHWTADGGTPITVAPGESAAMLATRYGVPTDALLHANGYSSAAQVQPGSRLIIPVYRAGAVAHAAPAAAPAPVSTPSPKVAEAKPDPKAAAAAAHEERRKAEAAAKTAREEQAKAERAARLAREDEAKARKSEAAAHEKEIKRLKKAEAERAAEQSRLAKLEAEKAVAQKAAEARKLAEAKKLEAKKEAAAKAAEAKAIEKAKLAKDQGAKSKLDVAKAEAAKAAAEAKLAKAEADKAAKAERLAKAAAEREQATAARQQQAAAPAEKQQKIAVSEKPVEPAPKQVDRATTASIPSSEETTKVSATESDKPEFRWPARGRIIQGFSTGGNDGINIAVPEGTPVKAAEGGQVAYAGSELKGYGNLVLIRHPNGFVTAYAHNGELDVKRGDTVKRGQTIARSGQSGNVGSPQLHFELRKGSTPVDPTNYLAGL